VLDLKSENYAVTARARRELGQDVIPMNPFGVTGAGAHALNRLDTLDPASPDVFSLAGGLADMLIVAEREDAEAHWNDTARLSNAASRSPASSSCSYVVAGWPQQRVGITVLLSKPHRPVLRLQHQWHPVMDRRHQPVGRRGDDGNVRTTWPSGARQPSHRRASAIGWPSCRAKAKGCFSPVLRHS
jgi:hypothetical protein